MIFLMNYSAESLIEMKYRFTHEAQQDLIKIRRFTLQTWGAEQSGIYLANLKNTVQLLSEMPSMGKNCQDELGDGVYRFPCVSHTIYYFIIPDHTLVVIAILHQNMVPEVHLASPMALP